MEIQLSDIYPVTLATTPHSAFHATRSAPHAKTPKAERDLVRHTTPAQSRSGRLALHSMAICQSQQQDHARAQLSQRISAWLGEVSTEQAEPQKRKRALQEMSGNIITTPRPRKRTKDGGQQDTSALPVQDDTTPRAAPFPLGDVVAPPGSPSTPHAPSSSSNASAEASSTTASSLKRKRGSSPVKRMAALRHADHGVERHSIQRWKDLPMAMQPLAKQMRDCGRCIALITPVERVCNSSVHNDVGVLIRCMQELFEYIAEGEDDDDQRLLDPTRARIGTSPAVAVLDRIRAHAEENMQLLRSEAAWNCNVHAPLFDQASMCSVYANTVRWENMYVFNVFGDPQPDY